MGDFMTEKGQKQNDKKNFVLFFKGERFWRYGEGGLGWYVSCSCVKKEQLP